VDRLDDIGGCGSFAEIYQPEHPQAYQGVADFLSASRSAGRYLLTIAGEMAGNGAISVVAMFELYYLSGFLLSGGLS